MGEKDFTESTVKPWHRGIKAVVESSFLEGFKGNVDVALGDMG